MNRKPKLMAQATYKQAGVDIEAGNALVERIKPLAKATSRAGTMGGIGGFGALFDVKAAGFNDPVLVSSTDGVGTKIKLAIEMQAHDTIGIDLVAMCVNDLVVQGATPLFFLDYFATSKLKVDVAERVIAGIARGCKESACALIGGETAEMPGLYAENDYDLAGFAVGAVERDAILPRGDVHVGDVLLGLASSGFHSNGYSLIHRLCAEAKLDYRAPAPFDSSHTLGEALLTPTRLYVRSCLAAIKTSQVKALAHITGGGFIDNIPRVLPESLGIQINRAGWTLPPIFSWLQKLGAIDDIEMHRTFNCGIGMVLVTANDKADAVKAILEREGETVFTLGEVTKRGAEAVTFHG